MISAIRKYCIGLTMVLFIVGCSFSKYGLSVIIGKQKCSDQGETHITKIEVKGKRTLKLIIIRSKSFKLTLILQEMIKEFKTQSIDQMEDFSAFSCGWCAVQ